MGCRCTSEIVTMGQCQGDGHGVGERAGKG